jgi:hypothetical protein
MLAVCPSVSPVITARQGFGKHVPAAMNTQDKQQKNRWARRIKGKHAIIYFQNFCYV